MSYKSLESVIRSGMKSESNYKSFRTALMSIFEKKIETHYRDQIVIGGYKTFHFEMCPKAQKLYSNLPEDVNRTAAEKAAMFLDQLFALEKSVIAVDKATGEDIKQAKEYAEKAMKMESLLKVKQEFERLALDKKWTLIAPDGRMWQGMPND